MNAQPHESTVVSLPAGVGDSQLRSLAEENRLLRNLLRETKANLEFILRARLLLKHDATAAQSLLLRIKAALGEE